MLVERNVLMDDMRGRGMTLQVIGDLFGLTRERVRQVTHHPVKPLTIQKLKKQGVISIGRTPLLVCSQCGVEFTNKDSRARIRRNYSGTFFCSKHCQGVFLGKHFGIQKGQVHPRDSKYLPRLPEIRGLMSDGYKLSRALKILNIPVSNHPTIKRLL